MILLQTVERLEILSTNSEPKGRPKGMPKRPDKLDLKIAEMEAKVVTELRRLIVQECLSRCRINQPWCPYLNSTKICPSIQKTLKEEVPNILQEMSEKN